MQTDALPEPVTGWTRTSPVAVVFFVTRFLRYLVTDGLPALAPLVAVTAAIDNKAWLVSGVSLLLILAGVLAVMSYLRFQFRLESSRIGVRRGIWHREQLSVDFDRIQNINLREPFYMRPFGLVLVGIETAGSANKEITLGGIPRAMAEAMREAMLGRRRQDQDTSEDRDEATDDEATVLVERTDREIARYGLTTNFMLWAAIALGVVFGSFDLGERLVGFLAETFNLREMIANGQLGIAFLIGFLAILGGLLMLPLISVAGALIRYHDYRLSVNGETYRRTSGLLTRHEESLPRHKIQAVEWHQNAIALGLERINLKVRVTSAGSAAESGQLSALTAQPFVVPVLTAEEAEAMTTEFLPGCHAGGARFSPIAANAYAGRVLMTGFLVPASMASVFPAIFVSPWFLLVAPMVLVPAWLILRRVGARWGYAVNGEFGFVRTGFIGQTITVFPLYKVQRVDIRQTPGQRRKGRAHLTVQLASHSLTVPYLPIEDAETYRDLALYHAESSDRPWY